MAIIIKGLNIEFPDSKFKLTDLNFSFVSNDITVIIGKNGCGKSTLLNCIAGLIPFESGEIKTTINGLIDYTLNGGTNSKISIENRKRIGYLFQQKALWQHFSVIENITHPLINVHGLTKDKAVKRAEEYLSLFKLDNIFKKGNPASLSGGQQRRLAIARTFAIEPELLLIDELEANLDQSALKLSLDILKEKFIDKNKTVLIISHSIDLLEHYTPNIVVLDNGRIIEHAKGVKQLFNRKTQSIQTEEIIKQSVDLSSSKWFFANQCLETAIRISESNIDEKEESKLYTVIGKEISQLLQKFDPRGEHLLMIATKEDKTSKSIEVRIRCAEKTEGFILDGNEVPKLDGLIDQKAARVVEGQIINSFIRNHTEFLNDQEGFVLDQKAEIETSGHNSLIDMMFETNGQNLTYKYTDRHSPIPGAYNIQVPIPNTHYLEKRSYYEFSKKTKNVYLIGCIINKEVKGIISVDTYSQDKWSDFIIQQLILIGNMIAITIKNHEKILVNDKQ